jgi:hypothetical protein
VDRIKAISVGLANSEVLTTELMVILSCIALKMEAVNSSETFVPVSVRIAAYHGRLNCSYFDVSFCVGLKLGHLT